MLAKNQGKSGEESWANIRVYMRQLLKQLIESTMREEVEIQTRSRWHERGGERIDYRNGFRYRRFLTHEGPIGDIRVPRLKARTINVVERFF